MDSALPIATVLYLGVASRYLAINIPWCVWFLDINDLIAWYVYEYVVQSFSSAAWCDGRSHTAWIAVLGLGAGGCR
ncbi:hypothetical protein F4823DRAFT_600894 [Ustulina deusta]|nr:hypothetical protein F4823DRAFT_600894 [Ustulina deusta]